MHYLVWARNQDFRQQNVTYCEKVSERGNSWVNRNQFNGKSENECLPQGEKLYIAYSIDGAGEKCHLDQSPSQKQNHRTEFKEKFPVPVKRVKSQHQGNTTKNFVNVGNLYHFPTFVIFISSAFSPEELAVKFSKQKSLCNLSKIGK